MSRAGVKKSKPQKRHKTGFRGPSPDVGKATQFQPGNQANPAGRPKIMWFREELRAGLAELVPGDKRRRSFMQKIRETLLQAAAKGDLRSIESIMDRIDGKPTQAIAVDSKVEVSDLSGLNTADRIAVEQSRRLAGMTDEELRERRNRLLAVINSNDDTLLLPPERKQ